MFRTCVHTSNFGKRGKLREDHKKIRHDIERTNIRISFGGKNVDRNDDINVNRRDRDSYAVRRSRTNYLFPMINTHHTITFFFKRTDMVKRTACGVHFANFRFRILTRVRLRILPRGSLMKTTYRLARCDRRTAAPAWTVSW